MFNLKLQTRLVKAPKKANTDTTETTSSTIDYTSLFEGVGKAVAIVAVSVIASDTARQVIVNAMPKN